MDLTTRDPELDRQAVSIYRQMQLGCQACPAFASSLRRWTGGTRAVLMGFGVGAIDKPPLQIRITVSDPPTPSFTGRQIHG